MKRYCFVCKQLIEAERADAIPETRLCTEHGKAILQYGGEFVLSASQERTSKKSSFKVNYGGITTVSTRNSDALERLKEDYDVSQLPE